MELLAAVIPTLDELLTTRARLGDRAALTDRAGSMSFAEWDRRAARLAAALGAAGYRPGERIAVARGNDVWSAVWFTAVVRAGLVWVGVNPRWTAAERDAACDHVAAAAVVGAGDPLAVPPRRLDGSTEPPRGAVAVTFTSGSSGRPKAAVHDERGVVLGAVAAAARGEAAARCAMSLSLSSLNALVLGPLTTLAGGAECVIVDRASSAELAELVERARIERMPLAAPTVRDWVGDASAWPKLAQLTDPVIGGSGCHEELLEAYAERVGQRVTLGYGLSEAPASVTREPRREARRAGSSGRALPHLRVEIDRGEIVVGAAREGRWAGAFRGMLGYWGEPAAGEGVLRTGDRGSLDEEGFLTVHGRIEPMIVRGGSNVDPAEVERVLGECPGVVAVRVVALDDARLGQVPGAVVAGRLTVAGLERWAAERLAPWKRPVRWAVVGTAELVGKVRVERLRELLSGGE